ncbi:hypothetical protein ACS0TY_003177 [Phlomoides rotata]
MGGGTAGHVILGSAFLIIGLWHLFNSIKLHSLNPTSYVSLPWFSVPRLRYLEPFTIIIVTVIFVWMELFNGQSPTAADGSIPSESLRHLEHSLIAFSFIVCAFFSVLLDRIGTPGQHGLLHFLQAVAFGQQLVIFHFHSTDHMGVEGQYHWLFQIITIVSLFTSVVAIGFPGSFWNSFVRGFSVVYQGVWLIVTGMLWTPQWMPKGCFLKTEMGREAVLCRGDRALGRAKALVNLQFGFYMIVVSVFCVGFYLVIVRFYPRQKVEYRSLNKYEEGDYDLGTPQKHEICMTRISLPI